LQPPTRARRTTFTATGTPGAADHIELVQGDLQTATVNTAVALDPTVRVVDVFGNAVAVATPVSFTMQTGGGSGSAPSVDTDANGLASVVYTLGTAAGSENNTMTAENLALPGALKVITFTASATPAEPTQLALSGPSTLVVGTCSTAYTVTSQDGFFNPSGVVANTVVNLTGGGAGARPTFERN